MKILAHPYIDRLKDEILSKASQLKLLLHKSQTSCYWETSFPAQTHTQTLYAADVSDSEVLLVLFSIPEHLCTQLFLAISPFYFENIIFLNVFLVSIEKKLN